MSTTNIHRAKILAVLVLGISSIATLGVLAINHYALINIDEEGSEPQNSLDEAIENMNPSINNLEEIQVSSELDEIKELKQNTTLMGGNQSNSNHDTTTLKNYIANISLPDVNNYKRYNVVATGYTAGVESTGKDPSHPEYGITFSGVYVRRDVYSTIAADTRIFPLGTILFIPGYGYGVVADTGSAIKGYKIDLYFDTVDQVYQEWGKKQVDVYVIKVGNGRVTEKMLNEYNEYASLRTAM